MTLTAPCQTGPTMWCTTGRHQHCSGRPITLPEGYVTTPPRGGFKGPDGVPTNAGDGLCQLVRGFDIVEPHHIWRCPCDCHHTTAAVQLELFGATA